MYLGFAAHPPTTASVHHSNRSSKLEVSALHDSRCNTYCRYEQVVAELLLFYFRLESKVVIGDGPRRPKTGLGASHDGDPQPCRNRGLLASRPNKFSLYDSLTVRHGLRISPAIYTRKPTSSAPSLLSRSTQHPPGLPAFYNSGLYCVFRRPPFLPNSIVYYSLWISAMSPASLLLKIFTLLPFLAIVLAHKSKLGPSGSKAWATPTATVTATPKALCAAGPVQCCASVVNSTATDAISALSVLSIPLPTSVVEVGLNCKNVTDTEVEDGFW